MDERHRILIVDDNMADVHLLREAIETAGILAGLDIISDGEKAIEFIDQIDNGNAPCPALVLLDLNLPRRTGAEVLEHLRQSQKCREARVLIVTSSNSGKDRAKTASLGANGYFQKPSSYDAFLKVGDVVKNMLAEPRP
jgi:two-component system, chemotaxis family, response regulator Rcp1